MATGLKSNKCAIRFWVEDSEYLQVKLYVQPGDGVMPLVQAINNAKKSVEIVIFRFDRSEVEKALASAVSRGVFESCVTVTLCLTAIFCSSADRFVSAARLNRP